MSESRNARLIVRYVDGQQNKILFSQPTDATNAMKRIEEAIKAQMLILEMEDRVLMIPFHQIKNLEVSPPPKTLPQYTLKGVRVME